MLLLRALHAMHLVSIANACSESLHELGLALQFFDAHIPFLMFGQCLFRRWHAGERVCSCKWTAHGARV